MCYFRNDEVQHFGVSLIFSPAWEGIHLVIVVGSLLVLSGFRDLLRRYMNFETCNYGVTVGSLIYFIFGTFTYTPYRPRLHVVDGGEGKGLRLGFI